MDINLEQSPENSEEEDEEEEQQSDRQDEGDSEEDDEDNSVDEDEREDRNDEHDSGSGSDASDNDKAGQAGPLAKKPRHENEGNGTHGGLSDGKLEPGWIDLEADLGTEDAGNEDTDKREQQQSQTEGENLRVQLVADHYSKRENQLRVQRDRSPIIHLKKLNNWVKSMLIRSHTPPGARVLDLACGKGGDFAKWSRANISYYVGIDVASGSIEDARQRYNGDSEERADADGGHDGGSGRNPHRRMLSFPATLACGDCFGVSLEDELSRFGPFDIVSCQFALHYSFETQARARMGLKNISSLLKPGGVLIGTTPDANVLVRKLRAAPGLQFGNEVYSIRFDQAHASKLFPASQPYGLLYHFQLEDAVDCPEWLVPFHCLQKLAAEYGLKLRMHSNFHEFVQKHSRDADGAGLMRRIVGHNWWEQITEDEWDAAYLYCVFVFEKEGIEEGRGEDRASARGKRDRAEVAKRIESDDIIMI